MFIAWCIAAAGMAVVAAFQLALALGAPWGSLAMGGKFPGRYPPVMRGVCLLLIALYAGMTWMLAIRAGLVLPAWYEVSKVLTWAIVVLMVLGVAMNLATPSKWERRIWAPVAGVLMASSLYIACN
jgi:hypothetical protein